MRQSSKEGQVAKINCNSAFTWLSRETTTGWSLLKGTSSALFEALQATTQLMSVKRCGCVQATKEGKLRTNLRSHCPSPPPKLCPRPARKCWLLEKAECQSRHLLADRQLPPNPNSHTSTDLTRGIFTSSTSVTSAVSTCQHRSPLCSGRIKWLTNSWQSPPRSRLQVWMWWSAGRACTAFTSQHRHKDMQKVAGHA